MTNSEAKATPRPWHIITGQDKRHMNFPIMCEKNHLIGSIIWGAFYDRETAQANASLIVKAINNHEALLEACRKALHVHIDYVRESGDDSIEANEYQEMLSQAIANAEGR